MFPESAKGESELGAVTASVKEKGIDETRRIWEEHWRTAVSEQDWDWFKNQAKGTSIRLPVGWWIMGGHEQASRLKGTDWAGLEGVYCGAWVSFFLFFLFQRYCEFLALRISGKVENVTWSAFLPWSNLGYQGPSNYLSFS